MKERTGTLTLSGQEPAGVAAVFRNIGELVMPLRDKRKKVPPDLTSRLAQLEEKALRRGIHIHYDLLEAAGLKLKGGICKLNGEYHIFVDRRRPIAEKIDFLQSYLDHPLPDDIPSNP